MSQKIRAAVSKNSGKKNKTVWWPFVLVFCLILFGACFFITYQATQDESELSGEDAEGFTSDDLAHIYNDIQNLYDEAIFYRTGEAEYVDAGTSAYYIMDYYVCVESSEDVTVYRYYKFVKGSSSYTAGTLLCQTLGISTEFTKSDLFGTSDETN